MTKFICVHTVLTFGAKLVVSAVVASEARSEHARKNSTKRKLGYLSASKRILFFVYDLKLHSLRSAVVVVVFFVFLKIEF